MKSTMMAAAAALALLAAPTAWAAEFTPAPNASYVLDQDTPDDSMSLWELDDMSGLSAMRAQVTVRRIGKPKSVKPGAVLVLSNGSSEAHLSFLFTPKGSIAVLSAQRGETELGSEVFLAPLDPKETFGLEIDWTPAGLVTVRIASKAAKDMGSQGFEKHEVKMDGAPTKLEIMGAASEVEFKPLKLGTVR